MMMTDSSQTKPSRAFVGFPEQAPCAESITCSVCKRSMDEKASLVQRDANNDLEESKSPICDEEREVEPVENK